MELLLINSSNFLEPADTIHISTVSSTSKWESLQPSVQKTLFWVLESHLLLFLSSFNSCNLKLMNDTSNNFYVLPSWRCIVWWPHNSTFAPNWRNLDLCKSLLSLFHPLYHFSCPSLCSFLSGTLSSFRSGGQNCTQYSRWKCMKTLHNRKIMQVHSIFKILLWWWPRF